MEWDRQVPGCFGAQDALFANHPLDKQRAFEWLTSLRRRQATIADAEQQVRAYLIHQRCGEAHIQEQLAKVRRHLAPWLWG